MKRFYVVFYGFFFLLLAVANAKIELYEPHFQAHPILIKRIQDWLQSLQRQEQNSMILEDLKQIGQIAYPQLKDALEKGDEKTQKKIIEILAYLKIEDCVGILLKILQKETADPRVREAAAMALGEFKSIEILENLIRFAFHRDSRIFTSSSYALFRKPSRQSIPYLIPLLKHWDENIKNKAHLTLAQLTGQNNIPSDFASWQRWWTNYQDTFEDTQK